MGLLQGGARILEQFDREARLDLALHSKAVPVDDSSLIGIEIGHLDLKAVGSSLAGQGSGQGGLPHPALLRDERDDGWHAPVPTAWWGEPKHRTLYSGRHPDAMCSRRCI